MNLAPKDFPEFAQAIQYSIATPAALCHEKLREKDREFGYLAFKEAIRQEWQAAMKAAVAD